MILFLTNCSLTKATGGEPDYDHAASIAAVLSPTLARQLLARRAQAWRLMQSPAFRWKDKAVSALPFNRDLAQGPDLGGRRSVLYLPATERYQGRFFQALGESGRQALRTSPHHVLFLSGLYGLLRPAEPVQLYSCPLDEGVSDVWGRDHLTAVLREYIERFGILRIIDMTAMDNYRALIDWDDIEQTGADVLHGFDIMAPGDQALTAFGICMGRRLLPMTEDELIGLETGTQFDTVMFRAFAPSPEAPANLRPGTGRDGTPSAISTSSDPWRPKFGREFIKDIRKYMRDFSDVMRATVEICHAPRTPRGDVVQRLKGTGEAECWRYRLHGYRLVYRVVVPARVVWFERLGPRGGIYE